MEKNNSIKLIKVYYYSNRYSSDINSEGKLKLQQGWVVTGLLGTNKETFYIPNKWKDLPIIGIMQTAYETIDEYNDDDRFHKEGDWDIDLDVTIRFHGLYLLFVLPPWRYKDRYHVNVTYLGDGYENKTNCTSMYQANYFVYYPYNNNLLQQLLINTNSNRNIGYCSSDTIISASWGEHSGYIKNKAVYDHRERELRLSQSNTETFKTSYLGEITLSRNGKYSLLHDTLPSDYRKYDAVSFKGFKVGKYFFNPDKSFEGHREDFDNRKAYLAFVYTEVKKKPYFAFNAMPGTEEIIIPYKF